MLFFNKFPNRWICRSHSFNWRRCVFFADFDVELNVRQLFSNARHKHFTFQWNIHFSHSPSASSSASAYVVRTKYEQTVLSVLRTHSLCNHLVFGVAFVGTERTVFGVHSHSGHILFRHFLCKSPSSMSRKTAKRTIELLPVNWKYNIVLYSLAREWMKGVHVHVCVFDTARSWAQNLHLKFWCWVSLTSCTLELLSAENLVRISRTCCCQCFALCRETFRSFHCERAQPYCAHHVKLIKWARTLLIRLTHLLSTKKGKKEYLQDVCATFCNLWISLCAMKRCTTSQTCTPHSLDTGFDRHIDSVVSHGSIFKLLYRVACELRLLTDYYIRRCEISKNIYWIYFMIFFLSKFHLCCGSVAKQNVLNLWHFSGPKWIYCDLLLFRSIN